MFHSSTLFSLRFSNTRLSALSIEADRISIRFDKKARWPSFLRTKRGNKDSDKIDRRNAGRDESIEQNEKRIESVPSAMEKWRKMRAALVNRRKIDRSKRAARRGSSPRTRSISLPFVRGVRLINQPLSRQLFSLVNSREETKRAPVKRSFRLKTDPNRFFSVSTNETDKPENLLTFAESISISSTIDKRRASPPPS